MNESQLHEPLSSDARIPWVVAFDDSINFKTAGGLPFFLWPNGRLCFEANAYFVDLLSNKKLSLRQRGGSARQYAFQISEFIRFLWRNGINVMDMTDSYFKLFIDGLSVPKDAKGRQLRSNSRIRQIGSRCLDFMHFTSSFFGHAKFVSKAGAVNGVKIDRKLRAKLKGKAAGIVWYHSVFPLPSANNKRFPIYDPEIKALQKATLSKTPFLKSRTQILLSILEYTGARRDEAAHIRVDDIIRAYNSKEVQPLVRLITVKNQDITFRFVPVPLAVISSWVNHIKVHRRVIVHKYIGDVADHGYLFVASNTGRQVSVNTITNEIYDLRKVAGFKAPAHPHLFRHRFITEMLARLIYEHDLENSDDLRKALAGSEAIRQKLQEWSGHKRIGSLDTYIADAYKIITNLEPAIKNVMQARSKKFLMDQIALLEAELDQKLISEQEYFAVLKEAWSFEFASIRAD